MRLTMIRDDNVVGIDKVYRVVDLSPLHASGIRGVQWEDSVGHIEFDSGPNEDITDISEFQPYIDAWTAAAPPPPPEPTPAERIAYAHARINAAYEAAVNLLTAGYPPTEIASWPKQEAEARAFLDDENAKTPWLSGASIGRGLNKTQFSLLIVRNADALAPLHGALTGKRQVLRDQIDALGDSPTQAQLDAVQW